MVGIWAWWAVESPLRRLELHQAIPTGPPRWIKPFSPEPRLKFLGACFVGEAEDALPLVRDDQRMPPRAQGQIGAEFCDDVVLLTQTVLRRQHDLMRPLPIDARWRQLAFAPHPASRTAAKRRLKANASASSRKQ